MQQESIAALDDRNQLLVQFAVLSSALVGKDLPTAIIAIRFLHANLRRDPILEMALKQQVRHVVELYESTEIELGNDLSLILSHLRDVYLV